MKGSFRMLLVMKEWNWQWLLLLIVSLVLCSQQRYMPLSRTGKAVHGRRHILPHRGWCLPLSHEEICKERSAACHPSTLLLLSNASILLLLLLLLPSFTGMENQIIWPSSMDLWLSRNPPTLSSSDRDCWGIQAHGMNSHHILCVSSARQLNIAQTVQANLIKMLCKVYLFCWFCSSREQD